MKKALVLGGGGFIGSHMIRRLKQDNFWVRGVDLKQSDFSETAADEFVIRDLRDPLVVKEVMSLPEGSFDEVFQFAADMGGAGYIFIGDNDADVMHNSAAINLNVAQAAVKHKVKKLFYSSSACIYPERNQLDPNNPNCVEDSAYPADPDSEYGWEKLFSERIYLAFKRNHNLDVRIARYHNIFGPEGTWQGGKEKVPAAICRKIAESIDSDQIEVWGDGLQTRSFLYIDECIEATLKLTRSEFTGPVNIGSEEMVSINDLAQMVIGFSGKSLKIDNLSGDAFMKKYGHACPQGVRGRNSDNRLFEQQLGWKVSAPLIEGLRSTYRWIDSQVHDPFHMNKTLDQ